MGIIPINPALQNLSISEIERILLLNKYLININNRLRNIPNIIPIVLIKGTLGKTGFFGISACFNITKSDTKPASDMV